MQDVYDFFYDVNSHLAEKGLERLDDMLRPAIMSGVLSDMVTASLAKHSRVLTENAYFNGHPDLVVPRDLSGKRGEVGRSGRRNKDDSEEGWSGRYAWSAAISGCAYSCTGSTTKPSPRWTELPITFTEVLPESDYRGMTSERNARGELGTRTGHS